MFTGIIENIGLVKEVISEGSNKSFWITSVISNELKIDQSIAHNGVCLTVVDLKEGEHLVTAIDETLQRTNLERWEIGKFVNLERCMKLGDRLDGHMVQGHVDQKGRVEKIEDAGGSWIYEIGFDSKSENITVEKGSICVNGTSLTVVKSEKGLFSVAIIPYTYENTVFKYLKMGDEVNLEFDIVGKYISKMFSLQYADKINENNMHNNFGK
ncbi:MAG: riboflavin synthase [Cytophagales bacterium]